MYMLGFRVTRNPTVSLLPIIFEVTVVTVSCVVHDTHALPSCQQNSPLVHAGLIASSSFLPVLQPSLIEVFSGFGRSQVALTGEWLGGAVAFDDTASAHNTTLGDGEYPVVV
jgi:hypothetical protein